MQPGRGQATTGAAAVQYEHRPLNRDEPHSLPLGAEAGAMAGERPFNYTTRTVLVTTPGDTMNR